jgi:hypothetical protein
MRNKTPTELTTPRQIRFEPQTVEALKEICERTGFDFAQAARQAMKIGAPILARRMDRAIKATTED